MSVARIKSIRDYLAGKLNPRGLVFHHVPKCGGTSVGMSIRRRYLLSQVGIVPASSFFAVGSITASDDRLRVLQHTKEFREKLLLYHLHNGARCVSAHVRFSKVAYDNFHSTHGFVTILRDPVERFVSHFFYGAGREGHMSIDMTLEDFIDSEEGRQYGAAYCDYFSGLNPFEDFGSSDAIASAKKNLALFAVVGFLDDLDDFRQKISREFGFRPRIGHKNRGATPKPVIGDTLSPEILDRIDVLCSPDREIFEFARQEFGK
ncbi:MAG: sulfotransferase family 2 domain-containing protein [Gammaproteobacteria bacterium]